MPTPTPESPARRRRRSWPAIACSSCRYNQFSWWNKYQINPIWAAALGVIYFRDSFASSDDIVQAAGLCPLRCRRLRQDQQDWRAQLNVENIFNKGYWASADANNNISPGQPDVRFAARQSTGSEGRPHFAGHIGDALRIVCSKRFVGWIGRLTLNWSSCAS